MSAAEAAIAVAPPDAVELRIVRYRLRKSAAQGVSEWVGDAVLGCDGGPSDGPKPLRTGVVHWITASGGTVPFELPGDDNFGPDDIARLLGEARRRNLRCAVWVETDRLGGGSMQLSESWFSGVAPSAPNDSVVVERTPHGVVVTVDELEPPHKAWLLFYPVLLVSFAWIFFLFVGGLRRMIRENWERAMVGTGQRFTASLDADQLSVEVVRNGRQESLIFIDRAGLVALGTAFGFTAYTRQGAVQLPNKWATLQLAEQHALAPAITAAINNAIGVA